ncbi:hypothetical protein BsWGS_14361 [Bradybaena similaris]
MDHRTLLVILLCSSASAVKDATEAEDSQLYCRGSPEPVHSGCLIPNDLGVSENDQGHHDPTTANETVSTTENESSPTTGNESALTIANETAPATENEGCRTNCQGQGRSTENADASDPATPTECGSALLQEGRPLEGRSPVRSSQQATEFLVSNWNDLATWKPRGQVRSVCEENVEQAIRGYLANHMWALQVFDAWAKPGPSLLEGRSLFAGNYHQCRATRSPAVNNTAGFGGNYCVVSLANLTSVNVTDIMQILALTKVQLGTCLPDTCSEPDITHIFQERLEAMNLSLFLGALSADCLSDEKEFTMFTKVALVIVLVIGTAAILGTTIDLTTQFLEHKSSNHNSGDQEHEREKKANTQPTHNQHSTNTQPTGTWTKILLSFSVYTNGKRLLSTSQPPGSITVIPGLRFLVMSWIVIGHAHSMMIFGRASNAVQGNASVIRYRIFDLISNMPLGVDAFFAISGFLVAYLNMKKVLEKGWNFGWRHYFLHRYWRLTPAYMIILILIQGLQRFFVYGATAPTMQPQDKLACERNWWMNPVYLNNLMAPNFEDMCFGQSWSLAADFQFYLLSPLMLLPFYYHRNAGIASCLFFTVGQWILSGILSYQLKAVYGLGGQSMDFFKYVYLPFYARIAPFAIGILAGYILCASNGRVRMSGRVVAAGWILATVTGLAVMFGVHGGLSAENPGSLLWASIYNATSRGVWGACICWVIIACTSGYGGPISAFLSWSPFTVLGRLTYNGYLTQMAVLAVVLENLEQPVLLNVFSVVVYGTASLVFTCVVSAILVVCVEMPTLNLEKVRDHKKQQ